MGQAIGGSLAAAIGIAISPMPIIAVVLMLTTAHARTNGPTFLAGWLIGLGVVGAIVLAIAGPAGASQSGAPATWVSWLKIVLGALLLLVALRQFRSRPAAGEEPGMPKWMGTIDNVRPPGAFGLGALLAGANPKNLLLAVAGAAAVAQTGISGGQQAVSYIVFALIATVGVAAPLVIYFALGDRADKTLSRVKHWMSYNNAVIMSVLCLVIGTKLIGDSISALS
jgi:hypothetical protein